MEPRILLLDEPLAHLDPLSRKTLRLELARLHRDLAVTTIHVTRDAADALALSDRLAVLHGGRVQQIGEPADVYQHPVSRAVAEALGPANFLPVRVVEVRDLGVVVETERGHRVPVAGIGTFRRAAAACSSCAPRRCRSTDAAHGTRPRHSRARVILRVFEGARHVYEVDIGVGAPMRVEAPGRAEPTSLPPGRSRPHRDQQRHRGDRSVGVTPLEGARLGRAGQQHVGLVLLQDGMRLPLDLGQFLGRLIVELRLHVENQHRDVGR